MVKSSASAHSEMIGKLLIFDHTKFHFGMRNGYETVKLGWALVCFVFVMLYCLFIAALFCSHLLGKFNLLALLCVIFLVF